MTTDTATAAPTTVRSACCDAPLHTRPARPGSHLATVTHCTGCGVAVTTSRQ